MKKTASIAAGLAALAVLAAPPVQAHTGSGGAAGFAAGLSHPFLGLDHLLAMLGVGLWASALGGRSRLIVPGAFLGLMSLGALAGLAGLALPAVEFGILGSVLVLGLLIAAGPRLPAWAPAAIVGLFALFHGHAHGTEMPAEASGLAYGLGFLLATAALHGLGLGLGTLGRQAGPLALRGAGAAIGLAGLVLWLG